MPVLQNSPADIHYQVDDFAPPWAAHDTVLLQHGLGRSGTMFHGWVPHLSRDFRVVRADLPGAAQSPDPGASVEFTLGGMMASFLRLLDALRVDKVHYVGESLGGLLGIILAANHPDRVKSLTLVSTIVRVRPNTVLTNSVGYPTWTEAIEDLGMKEWWLKSRAASGEITGEAAKDNWFAEQSGQTKKHVAQALVRFAPTINAQSSLERVQAPTLLLSPGASVHTDAQEQQSILDAVPNSRQIIYHLPDFLQ